MYTNDKKIVGRETWNLVWKFLKFIVKKLKLYMDFNGCRMEL